MADTVVIQSCAEPAPHPWIERCMQSVHSWAEALGYDYRFVGDELFERVDGDLLAKIGDQKVIATDLARIELAREALASGYQAAVWMDADYVVFDRDRFILPPESFAVGREVWIQNDPNGRLRCYRKVHNALLLFRRGNSFVDFYADTAARLIRLNQGTMPPQFIGPKLLTALHNVVQLPVMESAAVFSPMVIRDLIAGEGPALELFRRESVVAPAGANLCSSSVARGELTDEHMAQVLDQLNRLYLQGRTL